VEYAGSPAVSAVYRELLDLLVPETLRKEEVYGEGDRNVQFSVFRQPDGTSHLYYMTTDWFNGDQTPRTGTLTVNGDRYSVPATLIAPTKVLVRDGIAVWSNETENEVLRITPDEVQVQGVETGTFTLARNGKTETFTVDFRRESVQTIALKDR